MDIQSVTLLCFSPTGTSRSIIEQIGHGIDHISTRIVDITQVTDRKENLHLGSKDLLIMAIPVYGGRVPILVRKWLDTMVLEDTPTVCVSVYGNRAYDDHLLELKNITKSRGGIPLAFAAFVGQHSFIKEDKTSKTKRPNLNDLNLANTFGAAIANKLSETSTPKNLVDISVPGTFPYSREAKKLTMDFMAVDGRCPQCGICSDLCPVDAIDKTDSHIIDIEKCIVCCACIKKCPLDYRTIKPGMIQESAKKIQHHFATPKEVVTFL